MQRNAATARLVALLLSAAISTSACGNKDPEENFQLWSNNEAGWQEIGKYASDPANPIELRARSLEVLIQGGHPSIVTQLVEKAADKDKVLIALVPGLEKMLRGSNEKQQLHAKQVLFETISRVSPGDADKVRAALAEWAFGDITVDDPTNVITEKLGKRLRPDEIERLGKFGVKGAEIMLGKAIAKNEILTFLQTLDVPEAKVALVNGLRRYHQSSKKVMVTGNELGYVQRTGHIDGLLYFFELYERLIESEHEDDENAAKMAIAAAVQWVDEDGGKKLVVDNWAKLKPVADKLMAGPKCDLRWWSAVQMVRVEGLDGLKRALAALPDDTNYGQSEYALNDVKLMITDFCSKDTAALDKDKKREIYKASLATERFIERIVAIRCLMVDGSDDAKAALEAFVAGRKKLKEEKVIDPLIVPQHAENLSLTDLAKIALEVIAYFKELDKLQGESKLTAKQVEYRKLYATFSFDRKGKALREFAEERAEDKIKREAAKPAK
ncbi:MAG: hypothetical protein RIT45_286 [Pseudomonadota bacterium]|jgi:hypothetical protein